MFFNFFKKKLKSKRGILPIVAAVVAGAIIAGVAIDYFSDGELDLNTSKEAAVVDTGAEKVTNLTKASDYRYKYLAGYKVYSENASAADLNEIKYKLKSSLVSYETQNSGSITDLDVKLKGADKIYGFSVFPVQIILTESIPSSLPQQSYVEINSIKVYLVDSDGRKWSEKDFTDTLIFRDPNAHTDEPDGEEQYDPDSYLTKYELNLTLKTPDPYLGKARLAAQGSADLKTLRELMNATVKKFQVVVEIEGEAKLYKWEEVEVDTDGDGKPDTTEWRAEYDKTVPIDIKMVSLSAWNHINNGAYHVDGAEGSLPTAYSNVDELIAYATDVNGAVSNFVGRVWATPCHVYQSTAQYRFCLIGEPDNLEPVPVTISDDYASIGMRIRADGVGSIGDLSKGSFGEMGIRKDETILSLYYTKENDTVGYEVYFVLFGQVEDECGSEPIWLVIKPHIAVLDNIKLAGNDERMKEIESLLSDGKVSTEDIQLIQQKADMMINELMEKKAQVEASLDRYKTNEKAYEDAKKAISCYEKAIDYLKDMKSTADPNMIRTDFYLAQNYEMEGDYYRQAAEYRLIGLDNQAEALEGQAGKIHEDSAKYEPSMWFSAGSTLGNIWQQFKAGLGIDWVPDWVLILVVVILVVGGAIIVLKLL
ncbi:hypothetical protein [Methanocaldococcus fervens]|uniref:Uncharacterized protein n=1 Tax=Methanocaldococcus fervens (strain DSM 4213 / JCM 15782 / AG86) TaxID=573064 RepID=C7P9P1_METFA|nr:hypothetical protein [Methanocaldococcus fervens]ACV25398.1 hypothetical protein Mefer_1595 [Methanocaldococcus fervens AG86]